jgi:hypothetical protein
MTVGLAFSAKRASRKRGLSFDSSRPWKQNANKMVNTECVRSWIWTASLLAGAVSATACGSERTDQAESTSAAHTTIKQDGGETIIVDVVPLKSGVATQWILDPTNELRIFRYEPTRLVISEARRGTVVDGAVLVALRAELEEHSRTPPDGGTENRMLLEDDQVRLLVCNPAQACRSSSGALGNASSGLRNVIETLRTLADAMVEVSDTAWHLRCVPVPDKQWASIERRGTYELTEMTALPEFGQRAIFRAVSPAGRFQPLSTLEAELIGSRIDRDQIFIRHETEIFGCELYSVETQ